MAQEYTVKRIDQLTRISDTGGVEKYFRHTIKTRGGTVLTVDISEADFTPEKAAPILAKHAIDADKILAL